jgi:rsbT co-antagonist protein RsbR
MASVIEEGLNAITKQQELLLSTWLGNLRASGISTDRRTSLAETESQAQEFLGLLISCAASGSAIEAASWAPMRAYLDDLSRNRAVQGFSADLTALFIFSFKKSLFAVLQKEIANNPGLLAAQVLAWSEVIDGLGIRTMTAFQKSREEVIKRQQGDLLELSTPVIKLWDGVLALPMIGTLDSSRTQVVMETLLQRIVETGSTVAILDITGVPTVDTLVAQHLMKTVTAIRLMGADCIISGIRPQIAQTIVHLGIDLTGITTKANLADALAVAMQQRDGKAAH